MHDKFTDIVSSMVEYPDEECNRSMRRGLDGCMRPVVKMCNRSMPTSRYRQMRSLGIVFSKDVSEDGCMVVSVCVCLVS